MRIYVLFIAVIFILISPASVQADTQFLPFVPVEHMTTYGQAEQAIVGFWSCFSQRSGTTIHTLIVFRSDGTMMSDGRRGVFESPYYQERERWEGPFWDPPYNPGAWFEFETWEQYLNLPTNFGGVSHPKLSADGKRIIIYRYYKDNPYPPYPPPNPPAMECWKVSPVLGQSRINLI